MDVVLTGFYAAALAGAVFVLLHAAWTDFKTMTIPNLHTVTLGVLFFPACGAAYFLGWDVFQGWQAHLIGLGVMLGVTFVMFLMGVWGAGDSKLASAIALWIGIEGFFVFLLGMAIMGLVLSLAVYGRRWIPPGWNAGPESWVGHLRKDEKVLPYGIALVVGGLMAFQHLGYFDLLSLIQSVG